MDEFDILQSAAAGMDAQRAALDVAARNVAAAEATPSGKPFERLVPRFAVPPVADDGDVPEPGFVPDFGEPAVVPGVGELGAVPGVGELDDGPGAELPVRYLGAVPQRGVGVDAVTEMVAVLDAQRAYESDASVFDVGKRLAERTIDLGRLQ